MGRFQGKVVVISGAARGQGRAHAVKLAAEGADVVAFDICDGFKFTRHPAATLEDLEQTQKEVEALGRRCLARKVDARDLNALLQLADDAMTQFGRIDVLIVNHGIWAVDKNSWELPEESWQESIDVMLTGAWKVQKAFVPKMLEGGRGGSVVFTSSTNGIIAQPGAIAYCAAKAAHLMMTKVLAHELGQHNIRVNAVSPGRTDTDLIEGGTVDFSMEHWPEYFGHGARVLLGGDPRRPASAIADAVAWLASDEAKFVTGVNVPVDSGRIIW